MVLLHDNPVLVEVANTVLDFRGGTANFYERRKRVTGLYLATYFGILSIVLELIRRGYLGSRCWRYLWVVTANLGGYEAPC